MAVCQANLNALHLDPPVALAPLAGITDLPFRQLVGQFGAGLVVSEMVASQEMVQAKPGVREKAEIDPNGPRTAVQIAGRDAFWMAEAARQLEGKGARLIDINMGCPAKKVVGGLSGSALMRTPDHALSLIEAVVQAVSIPVTLKMRLGWDDDNLNAADIAIRAEQAGIQRLVVHGRTRCQFYTGKADWSAIGSVKRAVSIPVLANGDIVDLATAKVALAQSGADGVMVGRGAQGRPWQLALIAAGLRGAPAPKIPAGTELFEIITMHYEAMLSFYGNALGGRVARKHLGWYMDDLGTRGAERKAILTSADAGDVVRRLRVAVLSSAERAAA